MVMGSVLVVILILRNVVVEKVVVKIIYLGACKKLAMVL
jgi:hypothetical protein